MKPLKLHIGCGKRRLKGFTHIDLADFPHIDYKHDGKTLPMFKSNSADLIYSCHMLEYFDRVEVMAVLKEWFRVLKKGGTLRLAVPDFEALIKVYKKTKDLDKVLGPIYGRWPVNKKLTIYHKTVYDYTSLKKLLTSIGFHGIKKWDWRKVFTGENKGYDDYSQAYFPHMDKTGILISLNIEARK